ncbi:MAG: phosphate acyltransferase PlsX [Bdellovibrionota bacterium]
MSSNGPLHSQTQAGKVPVAVDTMGGDQGFEVQVEGAVLAFKEFGVHSILVGPEENLKAKLEGLGAKSLPLAVCDAPDVITMDDSPVKAVRRKPNSSLCVAYNLVHNGLAGSIISSGNSGAMMAAGRLICGLLPGIERPAIATLIPKVGDGRPNVIIDSGANVDCHAQNLVQFAVMGSVYYSSLFEKHQKPRVGLLSNGTEPSKGTDVIRAASMFLSKMELLNYIGYVEGRDVATGAADVIVCDGFVGNVMLKSMEGCVRLLFEQIVHDSRKTARGMLALMLSKRVYRGVFSEKFDYTAHGGAPLLGLRKLAVVLHGSSGSRAVKNAIRVADSFARTKMVEKISSVLSHLEDHMPEMESDMLDAMLAKESEYGIDKMKKMFKRKPGEKEEDLECGDEPELTETPEELKKA